MKSPGALVDEALTHALNASGKLSFMVTKKRLSREAMKIAADSLEESARLIRSALEASEPG